MYMLHLKMMILFTDLEIEAKMSDVYNDMYIFDYDRGMNFDYFEQLTKEGWNFSY